MTKIEKLEAKALADKANEHEVRVGKVVVIWDGGFEYYRWPDGRGELIDITRDEAAELLEAT